MDEEVDRINDPNDKRDLIARFVSLVAGCERISEITQAHNENIIDNEAKNVHTQFIL
jgi:hypothetical protein